MVGWKLELVDPAGGGGGGGGSSDGTLSLGMPRISSAATCSSRVA